MNACKSVSKHKEELVVLSEANEEEQTKEVMNGLATSSIITVTTNEQTEKKTADLIGAFKKKAADNTPFDQVGLILDDDDTVAAIKHGIKIQKDSEIVSYLKKLANDKSAFDGLKALEYLQLHLQMKRVVLDDCTRENLSKVHYRIFVMELLLSGQFKGHFDHYKNELHASLSSLFCLLADASRNSKILKVVAKELLNEKFFPKKTKHNAKTLKAVYDEFKLETVCYVHDIFIPFDT